MSIHAFVVYPPLLSRFFYVYLAMDKIFKLQFFFILGGALLAGGCATTANLDDNPPPAIMIQRAQEATDRGRHNLAMQYYEALLERHPDRMDLVITAKYEIAFINYRQRNLEEARAGFNEILDYFEEPDAHLLPQQFRRLSQIVLERIDEMEANPPRRLFGFLRRD